MIRPANIQRTKDDVIAYYNKQNGKFYRDYNNQINLALGVIAAYVNKPQYCIVLDIDETILDKSELGRSVDFGYTNDVLVQGWTRTDIPAFSSMVELMLLSTKYNIKVYAITARTEHYRASTVAQFEANGIKQGSYYERLVMKPNSSTDNTITFKSAERKKLEDAGNIILLNIGDHDDDLVNPDGSYSGMYPVLLPNYMY